MLTQRKIKRYGWQPDLPDRRDFMLAAPFTGKKIPIRFDLRPQTVPVYDQLALGSCTANAGAEAVRFAVKRQGAEDFNPSRLMLYYATRDLEGDPLEDNGAELRDTLKVLNSQGVCSESEWPYDINKFFVRPDAKCYEDALHHEALRYLRLGNYTFGLRSCLASGFPFIFGFTVYESFESDGVTNTGRVPMPMINESVIGGHAVMCVGYDDVAQMFTCQNSWGVDWGDKGFFYMPYAYLGDSNLSSDFWTIRFVEV